MPASPCSAKHRSSRSGAVALTPRMSTPWLRTSRTPTSSAVWAASATSGVTEWAWLTWVWMARLTPRRAAVRATRSRPSTTSGCEPVLGQAHRAPWWPAGCRGSCRSSSRRIRYDSRLLPRHVGHVAAGDDDVADARVGLEVGDVRVVPVDRLEGELELVDRRRGVADQVHPGAVAAVLRAGGEQLGEHLGGVAVGEALGDPHVVLVQRVAGGVRVRRPVGAPVGGDRDHVAADRVGVERLGGAGPGRGTIVLIICGGTSIDMVASAGLVGRRGRRRSARRPGRRGRRAAA